MTKKPNVRSHFWNYFIAVILTLLIIPYQNCAKIEEQKEQDKSGPPISGSSNSVIAQSPLYFAGSPQPFVANEILINSYELNDPLNPEKTLKATKENGILTLEGPRGKYFMSLIFFSGQASAFAHPMDYVMSSTITLDGNQEIPAIHLNLAMHVTAPRDNEHEVMSDYPTNGCNAFAKHSLEDLTITWDSLPIGLVGPDVSYILKIKEYSCLGGQPFFLRKTHDVGLSSTSPIISYVFNASTLELSSGNKFYALSISAVNRADQTISIGALRFRVKYSDGSYVDLSDYRFRIE